MKVREAIAYFCTILAAVAFVVVFLWLMWSALLLYMRWTESAPPPSPTEFR